MSDTLHFTYVFFFLILKPTLLGLYSYYSHFSDEETEGKSHWNNLLGGGEHWGTVL